MNRIVLIGNGYDLSCGLKTSYHDFIFYYLKSKIERNEQYGEPYEDGMILVRNSFPYGKSFQRLSNNVNGLQDIIDSHWIFISEIHSEKMLNNQPDGKSIEHVRVEIKSKFFLDLLISKKQYWRDIEGCYFESLLGLFKSTKEQKEKNELILKLNSEFEELKFHFINYMRTVNSKVEGREVSNEKQILLKRCFDGYWDENVYKRFFGQRTRKRLEKRILETTWFVNFNYTELLERDLDQVDFNRDYRHLYIHGSIKEPDSIIFGYGDDTHLEYNNLEQSGNNEVLKHIKAFYYSNSKEYIDLMNLLESDQFEVYVIGHSLGLSDRVLLKTIFENENCRAIRLFHRGSKQSQFDKRISLSRHVSDKQLLRRRMHEWDSKDELINCRVKIL